VVEIAIDGSESGIRFSINEWKRSENEEWEERSHELQREESLFPLDLCVASCFISFLFLLAGRERERERDDDDDGERGRETGCVRLCQCLI
jgi:hypothetical protein